MPPRRFGPLAPLTGIRVPSASHTPPPSRSVHPSRSGRGDRAESSHLTTAPESCPLDQVRTPSGSGPCNRSSLPAALARPPPALTSWASRGPFPPCRVLTYERPLSAGPCDLPWALRLGTHSPRGVARTSSHSTCLPRPPSASFCWSPRSARRAAGPASCVRRGELGAFSTWAQTWRSRHELTRGLSSASHDGARGPPSFPRGGEEDGDVGPRPERGRLDRDTRSVGRVP